MAEADGVGWLVVSPDCGTGASLAVADGSGAALAVLLGSAVGEALFVAVLAGFFFAGACLGSLAWVMVVPSPPDKA